MANNDLQPKEQKHKFSVMIRQDSYKNLINNTLGDPERAKRFVSAISSAVAINPDLQDCDAGTILSAGLLGESLNLSPSPQLGQYYLVPFNDNKRRRKVAQFQLGYKGYMQLAIRSGQIKKMNVLAVKQGELVKYNPYEEIFEADYIEDETEREQAPTIGYYAMFELINGYRKILYWTKEKMERHAIKYSKGYRAKKGYTFWEKDFDTMACKTMLRQLISKGGCPMSIEMQSAYERDMSAINEDGTYTYVDNTPEQEPIISQTDDYSVNELDETPEAESFINDMPDDAPAEELNIDEV